jgi:hypothetical protein
LAQTDVAPDLAILSTPSVTSIQQLRGKPLMVDSSVSGFAYALRKVLALYGLRSENVDYGFQVVGSTPLRYAALTKSPPSLANGSAVYATISYFLFVAQGVALPKSAPL